jgi:hypothetical protein
LCIACALVFASYNPAGLSHYHWAISNLPDITPFMAFSGLVLLISWVTYIRATLRSLGIIGITLAIALLGTLWRAIIDLRHCLCRLCRRCHLHCSNHLMPHYGNRHVVVAYSPQNEWASGRP